LIIVKSFSLDAVFLKVQTSVSTRCCDCCL